MFTRAEQKTSFAQQSNKRKVVFNDESFKDLVDEAHAAGYFCSLIALFLDSPQQSKDRVAVRGMQQSGITISGSNVNINFNESFKNIATYFLYFDNSYFIFTGKGGKNQQVMTFEKSSLVSYHQNELKYPQLFAQYSFSKQRLGEEAYTLIKANENYTISGLSSPSKFKL